MWSKFWSGVKSIFASETVRTAGANLASAVLGALAALIGLGCSFNGSGVGMTMH